MLGATHDLEHPPVLCPPFAGAKHVGFFEEHCFSCQSAALCTVCDNGRVLSPNMSCREPQQSKTASRRDIQHHICVEHQERLGWDMLGYSFLSHFQRISGDLPTLFQGHWVRAVIEFVSHGAQQLRCGQLPQWILSQCLGEDWQQLHGLHQARQQMSEFDAYHRVQKRP